MKNIIILTAVCYCLPAYFSRMHASTSQRQERIQQQSEVTFPLSYLTDSFLLKFRRMTSFVYGLGHSILAKKPQQNGGSPKCQGQSLMIRDLVIL
jgi:cell division FtsZ-interacting protein ZapD